MHSMIALLALAGVATASQYTPAAMLDRIIDLPGLEEPYNHKMFSGYIDVGAGKKMFYWHVESEQASQATDPLVMWTNGGPGCSGVSGFMTEQGPFRPEASGKLRKNSYHWNQIANMVFIEQPAGVGFSEAPEDTEYGDQMAAVDMHAFLKGFLQRFPQYETNALYISSESYGGHYMPALAKYIVDTGDLPNFKGVFLGNPLTYMPYRDYGFYATLANHNIYPLPVWRRYLAANCRNESVANPACVEIENEMAQYTADMDLYAMDFPVCAADYQGTGVRGHQQMKHIAKAMARATGKKPMLGSDYFPGTYTPCDDDWADEYLNREDVRMAIHAVPVFEKRWSQCSDVVGSRYSQDDVNQDVRAVWQYLQTKGLDLVIYSGDDDTMCSTTSTQEVIWDFAGEVKSPWAQWRVDEQVAGFQVKFNGLSFVTVHGAGHMVPSTRPAQALHLFQEFLGGKLNKY